MSEVFFVKIILLWCLFQTITAASGTGKSYETNCVCIQASPNNTFCWEYKCHTDELPPKCFSGDSTVEIKTTSKEKKAMNKLKIGDEILVDINNQGQRIYEPIYSFIHASPNGIYDYLKISVGNNNSEISLIISSNHLIYRYNEINPIFAGYLKTGDQLQIISQAGLKQAGIIRNIKLIQSQGFYAPLTASGKLVVNDIVVSNYASVSNHQLAHFVMQPYRWWIQWTDSSSCSESINLYCQWLYKVVEHINKWIFSIGLYDGYFIISNF